MLMGLKRVALLSIVIYAYIAISNLNLYNERSNSSKIEINYKGAKFLDGVLSKHNCQFTKLLYTRYTNINSSRNAIYLTNYKYEVNRLRYAIFSLGYGYKKEKYYTFINSLKSTHYIGDLFFFVSNAIDNETVKYLETNNAFYLKLNKDWPYYSSENSQFLIESELLNKMVPKLRLRGKFKFVIMRYILIQIFLIKYKNRFDFIVSLDLRDVIFQENPFNWNIPTGVVLFEESRTQIHFENPMLMKWLRKVKKKYTKIIGPYYVINGGTIYCSVDDCLEFFEMFRNIANDSKSINPNDQSIFNIIAYHEFKKRNLYVFPNYFGPVKTMSIEDSQPICLLNNFNPMKDDYLLVNKEGMVTNIDESIPHILHSNFKSISNPYIAKFREKFEK